MSGTPQCTTRDHKTDTHVRSKLAKAIALTSPRHIGLSLSLTRARTHTHTHIHTHRPAPCGRRRCPSRNPWGRSASRASTSARSWSARRLHTDSSCTCSRHHIIPRVILRSSSSAEWPFGNPPHLRFCVLNSGQQSFNRGLDSGQPLLNADGKPPGGLACGAFGLSRGSVIEPFEPQTGHSDEAGGGHPP